MFLGTVIIIALFSMSVPVHAAYWTPWSDKSNPDWPGDYETIGGGPKPCGLKDALAIQARSAQSGLVLMTSVDRLWVGPKYGLRCFGSTCQDYRVRYGLWNTGDVTYTNWQDDNNPGPLGDTELLENTDYDPQFVVSMKYGTVGESESEGSTNRFVDLGPTYGLRCSAFQQEPGVRCLDYQVRYKCPGFPFRKGTGR